MIPFSLKVSPFLRIFLVTLALMNTGQKGYASCAEHENDDILPAAAVLGSERPAAAVAPEESNSAAPPCQSSVFRYFGSFAK